MKKVININKIRPNQVVAPVLNLATDMTPTLSIIVAYYNETEVLKQCHERLYDVLFNLNLHCEIIYIDDGSCDDSWSVLEQSINHKRGTAINNSDSIALIDIVSLRLSRNFGKEAAMCAGLEQSQAKAVILLDADLQDPPELLSLIHI